MRGSKAAAELAALEGRLSSPDTQECKTTSQEATGCDFDDALTIDDCTRINEPQSSLSILSQPLVGLDLLVPGIEIFSCSRQACHFAKSQPAFDLENRSPQFTAASVRDTGGEHFNYLDPQDEIRTKRIDVNPAQHSISVLHESPEKVIFSHPYVIAAVTGLRSRKMEDFILPLDGSDGSNLSPTQENDPSVYIRLRQELLALAPDSQSSSQARICATQEPAINNGSGGTAQDTEISYAVNDTGHLTLDYQPLLSIPLHDSFDEAEVGEVSSGRLRPHLFNAGLLHPQTPSQARLVIEHPGTVMRPSQMFAETQPSPGSRDRHLLPPSSSRPSPGLFNQYKSPKHVTSSPLARRVGKMPSENAADFDVSSSPECSQLDGDGNQKVGRRKTIITGSSLHENFLEPFEVYTTRKESQERRRQQAKILDDGSQSSDDGFSDDEAELNRRAKRKKEEAARELAVISTSRSGSAGKDVVEVPSTSTGRRRSLAEEYEAQCSGFDARDTQPDTTIVDSQSAPAGAPASPISETTHVTKDDELGQSDPGTFHHQNRSQEDSAQSGKTADDDSCEQLPALEQNEESEETESDREGSKSPVGQPFASQVPSNIAELRTPAMHKKLPYVDGDTIVPETSPSEPHLRRYGDVVSQTPPVPSAEEIDDAFNPFTQDIEFNNLIQSPSPRQSRSSRIVQPTVPTCEINVEASPGPAEKVGATKSRKPNADTSTTGLAPIETPSEDTSEYITAPTSLPSESLDTQKAQLDLITDNTKTPIRALNGIQLREEVDQVLQIHPIDTRMAEVEVGRSEVKRRSFPEDVVGGSSLALTSLAHEDANEFNLDGNDITLKTTTEISGQGHTKSCTAKTSRGSSRLSKRLAKQSDASFGQAVDVTPASLVAEPSEVLPNRLRSANQLKGSSRALRRLLEESNVAPSTPASTHVTPTPTVQKVTRSSRRSSTNSSEKAQSTEPEANITPSFSTRRRTLSNQLAEPGLFDGMAFSVTYNASREEEKQQVLAMIRKNGGRVLEKGFDELFDMNAFQASFVARNNEAGGLSDGSNLTLTAAARGVGFACVIADEHSRRVKFMQALALGLPCISGRWIEHCVARKEILEWDQYHLAAGESSFLGGAIRSRNLQSYPANSANFANRFESRPKLLTGKSILLITGKGRVEERRKPYFFLTKALGASRVKHVQNNQEARRFLLQAESNQEEWDWVYVDENEEEAEKAIFGAAPAPARKRKRGSEPSDDVEGAVPPPKKVRIVSDEYVIQSLILGKFLEE